MLSIYETLLRPSVTYPYSCLKYLFKLKLIKLQLQFFRNCYWVMAYREYTIFTEGSKLYSNANVGTGFISNCSTLSYLMRQSALGGERAHSYTKLSYLDFGKTTKPNSIKTNVVSTSILRLIYLYTIWF